MSTTSGRMGYSSQIFIQTTRREPGVITWMACPLKSLKAKKPPKSDVICDNFRIWSPVSPEGIHKSKIEKVVDQLQPLRCWSKKGGELRSTKKLLTCLLTHPSGHCSGDYIRPLGLMCPQTFISAIDSQDLLAHTRTGTEVPPKILMMKISNLA